MNKHDMNEQHLQQLLQQQPPAPDAETKARHIAAAMAAFSAQPQLQAGSETAAETVAANNEPAVNEKKSNVLQGFLQRVRLTGDTHPHGSKTMNSTSFDNRPFWQKPALISGIAASSLAVLAGVAFMQHLSLDPTQQVLTTRIAEQSQDQNAPLIAPAQTKEAQNEEQGEEVVIATDSPPAEVDTYSEAYIQRRDAAAAAEIAKREKESKELKVDTARVAAAKAAAEPMGFATGAPAPMSAPETSGARPAPTIVQVLA